MTATGLEPGKKTQPNARRSSEVNRNGRREGCMYGEEEVQERIRGGGEWGGGCRVDILYLQQETNKILGIYMIYMFHSFFLSRKYIACTWVGRKGEK